MNDLTCFKLIREFHFTMILILIEFILMSFIEMINFKYLISMTKNSHLFMSV